MDLSIFAIFAEHSITVPYAGMAWKFAVASCFAFPAFGTGDRAANVRAAVGGIAGGGGGWCWLWWMLFLNSEGVHEKISSNENDPMAEIGIFKSWDLGTSGGREQGGGGARQR
jgi:hypothetical protein